MTLQEFDATGVGPALEWLGADKYDGPGVRLQMLTTALQESNLEYRRQMGDGPAKSFYQMERGGMVNSLLNHPSNRIRSTALAACAWRGVQPVAMDVWNAIENDDVLASVLARLGYLADPQPLPEVGNVDAAWLCYLRNWRPGKPHPEKWPALYARVRAYLQL